MSVDQDRLVEDQISRIRSEFHNMLNTLCHRLRCDLTVEKAQVSTLRDQSALLEKRLDDANLKAVNMEAQLLDMQKKVVDMDEKLEESETRNAEMKRELEQAKMRWRGIVLPGYHEVESERAKLRRKLERKEEELQFYRMKMKIARKSTKRATFILKEDDVVYRPRSCSSVSSSSSYNPQHHRRRRYPMPGA